MTETKITGVAKAHGTLFPRVGSYISDGDALYRVVSIDSGIMTRDDRTGDYIHVTVEEADWDDCTEDEQHPSPFASDAAEVRS